MTEASVPPDTGAEPLLEVANLSVRFGAVEVVSNVSFTLSPGRCLALVGESGSGKSVTARSLLGLAGDDAVVSADRLSFRGQDLRKLRARAWQRLRGREIGLVLQDALVSLDPLRSVGREIDDALRLHTRLRPAARRERVQALLASVGMPEPELRAGQLSGELSGGLRQRALIASAIALEPPLLIADEPSTALDTTVQSHILDLLDTLRSRGTAVLLISHDLAVVSRVADQVAVMTQGRIVEAGPTAGVLGAPRHEYTRRLLAAVPAGRGRGVRLGPDLTDAADAVAASSVSRPEAAAASPVLEARGLCKSFHMPGRTGLTAVDDVSFALAGGRTLGLVGESGSGKTTTARMLLGLTAPDAGEVRLFGQQWSALRESERRPDRPLLGAVYQDALSSFDPRWSVGRLLADAAVGMGPAPRFRRRTASADRRERVAGLLAMVGLGPELAARSPRTLSGGQRQRVGIARALAAQPKILICDEPVSSLDVSIQAGILDLLDDLQHRIGLSYVFISHDLSVVRHMSDDVAVMLAGRIVETAPAEQLFNTPVHPYTRLLLASAPRIRGRNARR